MTEQGIFNLSIFLIIIIMFQCTAIIMIGVACDSIKRNLIGIEYSIQAFVRLYMNLHNVNWMELTSKDDKTLIQFGEKKDVSV